MNLDNSYINISQHNIRNLVDLLQSQAQKYADETFCIYLNNGEDESDTVTYSMLNTKAMAIAAEIQKHSSNGDRTLLLFSEGIDFITGFFACLYAGVIAVPVQLPVSKRIDSSQFLGIAKDADISLILSTQSDYQNYVLPSGGELIKAHPVVCIDSISDDCAKLWKSPNIVENDIAMLQYTSGSTGNPKGVMVTHKNILYNLEIMDTIFYEKERSTIVSWLPLSHNTGLIGNVLRTLHMGWQLVLMPTAVFLQKPVRWLNAISKYKAKISVGPNFAYELCSSRVSIEQKQSLDLSCWINAITGAERVINATLDNFYNAFKECGFKKESFYPSYGLSECTLFVTGGTIKTMPDIIKIDPQSLTTGIIKIAKDTADDLVAVGKPWGQEVIIIDTDNNKCCDDMVVGEIWIKGQCVTLGYWRDPEKTTEAFAAYSDNRDGPFLRTGDLGFFRNGNLFITGRLKDLIIIRGKNIYPEDLESKVQKYHDVFKNNCTAAFSVKINTQEEVIILQEVDEEIIKNIDVKILLRELKANLLNTFQVNIHDIMLLPIGKIPRTNSGKVRRNNAKKEYESGMLLALRLESN